MGDVMRTYLVDFESDPIDHSQALEGSKGSDKDPTASWGRLPLETSADVSDLQNESVY